MRILSLFLCAGVVLVMGLVTACSRIHVPTGSYVAGDEAGVTTIGLDDHDYDLVVESVASEMFEQGLPDGYVVALGPVDTSDCRYDVQIKTLQKSLMVVFNKQGTLKFTAAVDAMSGNDSTKKIYDIIEFNYFKNETIDAEHMQKFGKLAGINGILFGRVSCIERKIPGVRGGKEITYRFVWELADTQTGILKLSHEKKIPKVIR
jgi:hypothetical protein